MGNAFFCLFVKKIGIFDIRQKAGEIHFAMLTLDFNAISMLSDTTDYKNRVQLVASAKQPTIKLRLASGVDSLKQAKVFIDRFQQILN